MSLKLLIDECLSPALVQMAVDAGYVQSTSLRDRGLLGLADWDVVKFAVDNDFTLVTLNAIDFCGAGAQAPGGLYAGQSLHAGLICLVSALPLDIERQRALFSVALEELKPCDELVNQVLEVNEAESGEIIATVYELPASAD